MESSVLEFASEHPEAGYKTIAAHFGEPKSVAESYVLEMAPEELLDRMRFVHKALTIISIAATLIVATRLIFVGLALYDYIIDTNGYATVEIIVLDETVFEEGD